MKRNDLWVLWPVALCALMCSLPAGCGWMASTSPQDETALAEGDSLGGLAAENKKLRTRLESAGLDLAKATAECQNQAEVNALLKDEVESLKAELDRVERQFVSLEQRLQSTETKASAVSAIAEAQLLLERIDVKNTEELDSLSAAQVRAKIKAADELMQNQNYAASVYYANRAIRLLVQAERRHELAPAMGTARVVSVARANVREGPGAEYEILTTLDLGTVVVQTQERDDWYRVKAKSGVAGWVHSSVVR